MNQKYSTFILYLLISLPLFSQQITFQSLTDGDILNTGSVFCVLQDRSGFMWFGTEYGLYRYDGHNFRIYRNDPEDINSLSDNTIWSLYEDSNGFLWIGTANGGLNRLDPYREEFMQWTTLEALDPVGSGLSDNSITAITEDRSGAIWVGTYKGGLNRFDPKTQQFFHWFRDGESLHTLPAFYVTSLLVDQRDQLWIGCYEGLFSLERSEQSQKFRKWNHYLPDNQDPRHNVVWTLHETPSDSGRGFWLGTFLGLQFFSYQNAEFRQFLPAVVENNPFSNSISSISEQLSDGERIFWVGSYGGLLRFNPATGSFKRWQHQQGDPGSLVSNRIIDNFIDRSGVLWIATNSGLNYIVPHWEKFKIWSTESAERNGPLLDVTAILKTSDEKIWIGTSDGLYSIQSHQQPYLLSKYPHFPAVSIWSLSAGGAEYLWIGTYGQGLFRLQIDSGKIDHWIENPKSPGSLGNNYIRALYQDGEGYVWIGLWGRGLNRFHPETGEWRQYLHNRDDPHSLSYNDVWSIYEDQYDNLWIGTKGGGLNLLDRQNHNFRRWQNNSQPTQRISHNGVLTINRGLIDIVAEQDTLASFWIGTENGLDLFVYHPQHIDSSSARILSFSEKNGLPSNVIKSIVVDEQGNLWLGTNLGLAKVQMENGIILDSLQEVNQDSKQFMVLHYTTKDGLPSNDFATQAACMGQSGEYFWGNSGGLISFKSAQLKENPFSAPVVISEFYIQNKEISGKLFNFPENTRPDTTLHLNHTQNFVSFRFSALDFRAPRECRFAYRLLGFNDQWIEAANRRFVSYTNLSPGNYTFQVKGTNSNGVWNEKETTLSFIISPPWWRSVWAYLAYIFVTLTIIWLARRYELNRLRLRHQLALQTFETRKFKELEQIKSRFFANLSHEFRTPLMLISGPVEQLRKGIYQGNEDKAYDLILRNTHRLLELIEQLLALSQLEAGSLPLHASKVNLIPLLQGLIYSFVSLAEKKGVTLTFSTYQESIEVWLDHDKFEKIISNLLSNALKFTPEEGTVTVKIEAGEQSAQGQNTIQISIADSGIGILEEHQRYVFDRFYQVDDSAHRPYGGSGIGLALVKELVDLHHWHISLQSETDKGSVFLLRIPLGNAHLTESETVSAEIITDKPILEEPFPSLSPAELENRNEAQTESEIPQILIVEDSTDVRSYLASLLNQHFRVQQATNGAEGLRMASTIYPDLIISDVMMPGMNGMEFCKRIKTDWQTSHIPVILLTAKATTESKIEGLETGADDYLTKPFNYSELSVRVKNLLNQRKLLREKFSQQIEIKPETITVNSLDQDFLNRALEIAKKNLDNADFDSESFARELFVSRSQLHRKLLAITGQAPGEFLRTFRLKRAAQLLLEKRFSVTQIAFEVGFNSPSHFTKAFRQQFNCLPSEFVEKNGS